MGPATREKLRRQFLTRRRAVLRRARRSAGADAALILDGADVRYLSGSTEGVSALLFGRGCSVAFTNRMFRDRAPRECPGSDVCVCTRGLFKEAADRIRHEGLRLVGFQEHRISLANHKAMSKKVGKRKLRPLGNVVQQVRSIKDDLEIRRIRRAVRVAERAFRELIRQGASHFVGKSERQLATELDHRMRLAGADQQAFPGGTIVASGPNSAACHHRPTSRTVRQGDPVLFDWGAQVAGYRSDITRVVFVGSAPPKLRELYAIVLEAHDAAVVAMRPGVRAHTIDRVARGLIRAAGYGEAFRHGLGHGLGLDVHEWPGFGKHQGKPIALKKNMVLTVEPGIYLNGIGGIRIEDDILVTAGGHERLNSLPRRLERMILR